MDAGSRGLLRLLRFRWLSALLLLLSKNEGGVDPLRDGQPPQIEAIEANVIPSVEFAPHHITEG
jgi:hypothetical protein